MCDLLGMSFSTEVRAGISLNIFQMRGAENPDGWGLAFYKEAHLQVIKEARSATTSPLYDFIEGYPQSNTFISHVRRSTRGQPSYVNTHPFYRVSELGGVRNEFCFAHNGTLTDLTNLSAERITPIGSTDSELLFCHLLEKIEQRKIKEWDSDAFVYLEEILREINTPENTLNCMISNGNLLFCYSDKKYHNGGLRYAAQKHPFGLLDFVEHGRHLGTVDIQSANISDAEPSSVSGHIVVTRKLTDPSWIDFGGGQLIVFQEGKIIYQ